jgi:hypothetical protein
MGKKIKSPEQKKECPSCGLGVTLESNICEFCGWDFEEENEWILQIEKLERDLMLEKQKFEPGTVGHKIESTLRNPVLDRADSPQEEVQAPQPEREEPSEDQPVVHTSPVEEQVVSEQAPEERRPVAYEQTPQREQMETPKVRRVRSVKAAPVMPQVMEPPPSAAPVRVRKVAAAPQAEKPVPAVRKVKPAPEPAPEPVKTRKVRNVRRVKE